MNLRTLATMGARLIGRSARQLSSKGGLGSGVGKPGAEGGYGVDLLAVAGSSTEKPFMLVNSYYRTGFRVSGVMLEGSVCVAPHASFMWRPRSVAEVDLDALRFIPLLDPPIDIVVIGTGRAVEKLDPAIRGWFEKRRIGLEVHTSPNACAMFNFLNQENRRAVAVMLPVEPSDSRADE
jgi:NADH dehydrogenase [ubiquinone] 1 alpha subcomplex assembly factor 3